MLSSAWRTADGAYRRIESQITAARVDSSDQNTHRRICFLFLFFQRNCGLNLEIVGREQSSFHLFF